MPGHIRCVQTSQLLDSVCSQTEILHLTKVQLDLFSSFLTYLRNLSFNYYSTEKNYLKNCPSLLCISYHKLPKKTVTFLCSFSYYVVGMSILHCVLKGDHAYWNGPPPHCESK